MSKAASIRTAVFVLLAIAFKGASFAKTRPDCPADPKALATEVLELQLAGYQLSEGSKCLSQDRFSHFLPKHVNPVEAPVFPTERLPKGAYTTRIQSVEEDGPDRFRVHYKIEVSERPGKKAKTYSDSVLYMVNRGPKSLRLYGCASVLETPKNVIVREECAGGP